jgi:hypothetical protein
MRFCLKFLGMLLLLIFVACNNAKQEEPKQETLTNQPAPAAVVDTPPYKPSTTVEGDKRTINGECIVFYHPAKDEMAAIPNASQDLKKFLDVVGKLKPELEAQGYAVYVGSDKSTQIHVSDSRSHLFERTMMNSKFGAVLHSSKNGPYFCEGLRDADNYKSTIERYFKP